MTEKIKITEYSEDICGVSFNGTFDKIISQLEQCKIDGEWDGIEERFHCEGGSYFVFYKIRMETDLEYDKRMKAIEANKACRRQMYERLKQEFECHEE